MASRALGTLATALLFLLAGCAGSGDRADPASLAGVHVGAIVGQVLEDSGLPVPAATVGLVETDATATTDDSGVFALEGIRPGTYTLAVQRLGFAALAHKVVVYSGTVSQPVLTLREVAVNFDPVMKVVPTNGFLACSVNAYYPTNVCGDLVDENRARFPIEIDSALRLEQLILELDWEPATPATGQHLELDLCLPQEDEFAFHCAQDDLDSEFYRYESGGPPLRMVIEAREMPLDEHLEFEAWVGSGFASPHPTLQQPFTLYITTCYDAPCPREFTALDATA